MCTESLLGVSEAQAVPGRVRAPGTCKLPVRWLSIGSQGAPYHEGADYSARAPGTPRRAGPPRPALSLCGFLPSGSPARPASPRSDSASSASATVSSASLPAGAAVHSGKCPKAVGRAGAGAGITVLQDLFFNIQPPLFLFFLVGFPQASHAHSTSRAEESFQGPFRRDLDLQLSSFISSPVPIQSTLVT